MKDGSSKLLEDRISALIERVRALAHERDALLSEREAMRSRFEVGEREIGRLRAVVQETVRELRQE